MKASSVLALVAGMSLALGMMVSPAAAKKCRQLCKDPINNCRAEVPLPSTCTQTVKNDKKACKKDIRDRKKACRKDTIAACKLNTSPDVCSPSGAFIDASLEAF